MAVDETKLYEQLTENLKSFKLTVKELAKPDPTVEEEVAKIYTQARTHRNRLVNFYIIYTIFFTIFVIGLIAWQAYIRVKLKSSDFQIAPQWALNLLVTGMFAQFIGLLTIVTQRVWDFEPFFAHHSQIKKAPLAQQDAPEENS